MCGGISRTAAICSSRAEEQFAENCSAVTEVLASTARTWKYFRAKDSIFFFEDIPEVLSPVYIADFFDWLGARGFLQQINGVIIGKMRSKQSFEPYAEKLREVVSVKYGLADMPILYGFNFGHASPICILPYGAEAELDADALKFTILESGVVS